MNRVKILFFLYPFIILFLFLYSFTQVDLSLTLSKISIYQLIEKKLQYVGFYQRPQSAIIFSGILIILFLFYFLFLYSSYKGKISIRNLKLTIFLSFVLLVFSYNAFSYDLFNYIFDAKIVSFYHLNPYLHKAADFSGDPMLSFMRWTHRTYPYGPAWLALTVPLSYIGSNIFLLTFFLYKIMIGLFYLGIAYLIYKISEIINQQRKIFNTVFWSLNPLVIIESLVSSHNDIPMIFFNFLAIYLFMKNKKIYSVISYLFSVGVKFSTGFLLPVFIYIFLKQKKSQKINWDNVFLYSFYLSVFVILLVTFRTTFQPWYLLFPLSLASIISFKNYIFTSTIVASVFATIIYIPYVLLTDYSKNYPQIVSNIEIIGLILTIILFFTFLIKPRLPRH